MIRVFDCKQGETRTPAGTVILIYCGSISMGDSDAGSAVWDGIYGGAGYTSLEHALEAIREASNRGSRNTAMVLWTLANGDPPQQRHDPIKTDHDFAAELEAGQKRLREWRIAVSRAKKARQAR
jgi:hypothetical protein